MFRRFRKQLFTRHLTEKRLGYLAGVVLTVVVGLTLLSPLLGGGLVRTSYDLPFATFLHPDRVPNDLVMVYVDPGVKRQLGQPVDQVLDRRFYAQLLRRLRAAGAKLVVFDIIFDEPGPDPGTDKEFAQAMREHGRVVLAAESIKSLQGNALTDMTLAPIPMLREAAGYGLANVHEDKTDGAVRAIDPGLDNDPGLSWKAAELLGVPVTQDPARRMDPRWLNYYCAPWALKSVNLDVALREGQEVDFRDKLVVVGAKPESLGTERGREEFGNPYSQIRGGAYSPGAAVHAQSLLNLVHGDWLRRLDRISEISIVLGWGLAITVLLMRLPPWYAIGTSILAAAGFGAVAAYVQFRWHIWFAWLVPAGMQTLTALAWSSGYQYVIQKRQKQRLRRALSAYVSPSIAEKVANAGFDLRPGGREVEATIMFTDLENFTQLSESLTPAETSRILIGYFEDAQRVILDQEGTVLKFIGDAVMAAWGTPLPAPNPAERAAIAALNMREAGRLTVAGQVFRTRVGVNTGIVLAGNLGTETKLDFTLIGDPINVAARLESLNKQLGTDILISDTTRAGLSDRILVRDLGSFVVAGKSNPIGIYEVLARGEEAIKTPAWITLFDEARHRFVEGDLELAEAKFQQVIKSRGGADGPSRFFLELLLARRTNPQSETWDGIVRLGSK